LRDAQQEAFGNMSAAARKFGISRRTLHRKINEMNLAKTKAEGMDASGSKRVITSGSGALKKQEAARL
jgi:predicted DNA-binding protein (UPF0251 family)